MTNGFVLIAGSPNNIKVSIRFSNLENSAAKLSFPLIDAIPMPDEG